VNFMNAGTSVRRTELATITKMDTYETSSGSFLNESCEFPDLV